MRVAIQTMGTRGDVQPYVALGLELTRRGHEVQVAAPAPFDAMVSECGLSFAPLSGEILALMSSPDGRAAMSGGKPFSAGLKLLREVRPLMSRLLEEEGAAVRSFAPDVIVHHPKSLASPHLAEALGVPRILAPLLPAFTPTSAFPSPLLPVPSLGPLNRLSHALTAGGGDLMFSREIKTWRQASLGLTRPAARRRAPTLYAYSPLVAPIPSDWPRDVLVSGYWFLDREGWRPSSELAEFCKGAERPIYVGFGSMPGPEARRLTRLVVEGLAKAGKRGVLAVRPGALDRGTHPPAHVRVVEDAPHDALFQLVGATVHHGGAGTTAAALRAGKPTLACPFFGDQPFWARRVQDLGVGPAALNRDTLTPEGFAASVMTMDDAPMRRCAAELGAAIRAEDGLGAAARFIEAQGAGALAAEGDGFRPGRIAVIKSDAGRQPVARSSTAVARGERWRRASRRIRPGPP